jgi:uncharacterized protein
MNLTPYPERYAICRLESTASTPSWARGDFVSITCTKNELSVVCEQDAVPTDIRCERDWCVLQVEGPMDLAIVGVLSSLTKPLAEAGINLFAISTFDTDYLLVKAQRLEAAKIALEQAGHKVAES